MAQACVAGDQQPTQLEPPAPEPPAQ